VPRLLLILECFVLYKFACIVFHSSHISVGQVFLIPRKGAMGIEKAKINIVMVGHVDYEKSITIKELNKPVAEKQIAEMNLTAIYKA